MAFIMPTAPHAGAASCEKGRLTAKRARIKTLMPQEPVCNRSSANTRLSQKGGKKGADLSLDALRG